jgi:hypothetical protein
MTVYIVVYVCLSILVIGIALAIAGIIITILDRNQINRMSNLVISATSYRGYRCDYGGIIWPNLKQEI